MISENYIITLCLLIFFSPYLIIICSSICLFKDMWENGKGYRGQSKNCILLPGFSELTVQLFVFDEITMKIELFRANAALISSSHSSLSHSRIQLPLPPLKTQGHQSHCQGSDWWEGRRSFWPPCPLGPMKFLHFGVVLISRYQVLTQGFFNEPCCCPHSYLEYVGSSQWNTHLSVPNPPALLKCPFLSVMLSSTAPSVFCHCTL